MPRSFLIKKSSSRASSVVNTHVIAAGVKRPWMESENKQTVNGMRTHVTSPNTVMGEEVVSRNGPFDFSTKLATTTSKPDVSKRESPQALSPLHRLKVSTPSPGTTLVDPSPKSSDDECSPKHGTPLEPLNPNTHAPLRNTWNRSPMTSYLPSDVPSSLYHYQKYSSIEPIYHHKGTNGYHCPPFLVPPPLIPVSHSISPQPRLEQLSPVVKDETSYYYCDNPSSKPHQEVYRAGWSTDAANVAVVPSPPPSSSDGEYTVDEGKQRKNARAPRYECCDCNKSYSTYSGLSKHRQFHCLTQNKKSFNCKYCDKVYVSLGALKMHIRTHTLPCKCKLCGKAFSRPWLLQGHIRTHTGEKPFACPHCSRAFADRSNLRAHLQTHSDVKKYSCKSCSKTFSRMSLLLKHEDGGCVGSKATG